MDLDFNAQYNRQDFLRFLRNDLLKDLFLEKVEDTNIKTKFLKNITKL